jgi:hypothetical protein
VSRNCDSSPLPCLYNDELISNSKNRIKTTWEIIKKETGKFKHHSTIESLRINNTTVSNPTEIAHYLNDYFSAVADAIIDNIKKDTDEINNDSSHFSYLINNFTTLLTYLLTYSMEQSPS